MGKKRKAGAQPLSESEAFKDGESSKMKITTFEDVADSEDEFHFNRDKVLLDEGPAAKRLRKWKDQDAFLQPSDEEVLSYGDESDEAEEEEGRFTESDDNETYRGLEITKHKQDIDDQDEDLGGWGPSKKDYYHADAIETEQDALDEEAEALRIQRRQLQAMSEADFGFDEDEWIGQKEGDASEAGNVVTEVLPQLQITDHMSEKERLKLLRSRYPEFEHISKEYLRLQPLHDELASAAGAAESLMKTRSAESNKLNGAWIAIPTAVTKYRACAAYLAAMAMYFAILGSTATEDGSSVIALDPTELHDHAVMESLLRCQRLWARVESLPVADPMLEATSNGDEQSVVVKQSDALEARSLPENAIARKRKEKKLKKSKSQLAAEAAQIEAEARRAERLEKTEQELATLSSLTDKSAARKESKRKTAQQPMLNLLNADDSDFGEETSLTVQELAEKARKKKSLRFYTSQITQKANKRDAAGKDYGGDADIPHRERLKDRQARLQAEAERRGQNKKGPGAKLGDDVGSDDDLGPQRDTVQGDDNYYDMVVARKTKKQAEKQDLAAAYAQAAKEGGKVVRKEEVLPDGSKRQITYEIQKNKGLTPHRSKANKNPRVKKKLQFQDKLKKLKSQKRIYSGGEGRGGYGGELTGIKKGLIRSTKL